MSDSKIHTPNLRASGDRAQSHRNPSLKPLARDPQDSPKDRLGRQLAVPGEAGRPPQQPSLSPHTPGLPEGRASRGQALLN